MEQLLALYAAAPHLVQGLRSALAVAHWDALTAEEHPCAAGT